VIRTPEGDWGQDCIRCELHKCRVGNPPLYLCGKVEDVDYLVVLEAPFLPDVQSGSFYNNCFDFVAELFLSAGIQLDAIAHTALVGCPSYITIPAGENETQDRLSYQKPTAEQIKTCAPRLNEIIYRIDPRLILTFGDTAWKSLVATKHRGGATKISDAAGEFYVTWAQGRAQKIRVPVLALLGLEQIINNPSAAEHAPMKTTLSAMTRARQYVETLKEEEEA